MLVDIDDLLLIENIGLKFPTFLYTFPFHLTQLPQLFVQTSLLFVGGIATSFSLVYKTGSSLCETEISLKRYFHLHTMPRFSAPSVWGF